MTRRQDRSGPGGPPGLAGLFTAFLKIGALGFGGVAPLAHHVIVVERAILTDTAYVDLFALASTLPGANTVNLAALLGDRLGGMRGAGVALLGLLGVPLCVVVLVAVAFQRYGGVPEVRVAVSGAAAAAAGLVGGTALRLLLGLGRDPAVLVPAAAIALAAAAGAPLAATLAAGIPASLGLQLLRLRRRIGS